MSRLGPSEQQTNINFVQEIEKNRCLYDNRLKEYSRRDITEKAWNSVGKKFNLTGSQCKEKWKNLRTVLVRYLRQPANGPSRKRRNPYYLANAMKFTIPFIKTHTPIVLEDSSLCQLGTETTEQEEFTEHSQSIVPDSPQVYSPPPQSPESSSELAASPETQNALSPSSSPSPPKRTRQFNIKNEIEEHFIECLNNDNNENENLTDLMKSSRKLFLLSLLQDVYSLSDAQMRQFKIKVLTIIDEMLQTPNNLHPSTSMTQAAEFQNSNVESRPK